MTTTIAAVCRLIGDLDEVELERWVVEQWVLPDNAGGTYVFQEIDVARVRLIVDLRRDLALDDQAIPVVLHLLDQLYALRRRVKALSVAIDGLPPDLKEAVAARLEADD
jgi:chaperone modulatory protein CbpM